jgi:hypothetical protein
MPYLPHIGSDSNTGDFSGDSRLNFSPEQGSRHFLSSLFIFAMVIIISSLLTAHLLLSRELCVFIHTLQSRCS